MSDVVARVQEVLPSVRSDLEDLVRIEAVWADPARRDEVHRSAKAVADLLRAAGFDDIQDSRRSFLDLFDRLRQERVIPEVEAR